MVHFFLQYLVKVGDRRVAKILAVLVRLIRLNLKQLLANILLIQMIVPKVGDIIRRIHHDGGQVSDCALFHHLDVHLRSINRLPIRLRNISGHALLDTQIHIRLLLFFPFLLNSD